MKPRTQFFPSLMLPILVSGSVFPGMALAQTEVPHTFQTGQPARASEVNENFTALEQGIQQLEGDASTASGQVLTAIPLASEARYLFADYFRVHGDFPGDNATAGAPPAGQIQNAFVTGVSIGGGLITVSFGNSADAAIQSESLIFNPVVTGTSIYYTCNTSSGLAPYFDPDACVFVDEPPEPITTIRRQVESAIAVASEARWLVEDTFRNLGYFADNNPSAGAEFPGNIQNHYVSGVSIGLNGVVTATYGNNASVFIAGESMTFTPSDNLGSIVWTCSAAGIPGAYTGYLDEGCVLPVDVPPKPLSLIRDQFRSGFPVGNTLQGLIEAFYVANGSWPQSNADLGVPDANNYQTNYLVSASVGAAGALTLTYGNRAHPRIQGNALVFTPTENGASFSWACTAPGVPQGFLPYECWN
jgi:type IV pilus assembly protein PilA